MMRCLVLLLGLCWLPAALAWAETRTLEQVARAYAVAQPGLQSYRVTLDIDRLNQVLEQWNTSQSSAASGEPPTVFKFWSRTLEQSLVQVAGPSIPPLAQQWIEHYTAVLTIDLRSFLLPVDKAGERTRLLENSRIVRSEHRLGETRIESLAIEFPTPTDLNGAFYGTGLEIPQRQIRRLVFEFDLIQETVRHIEVMTSAAELRTVELRHYDIREGQLLNEVVVTSPDGTVDDRFKLRFDLVGGFWLPVRLNYSSLTSGEIQRLYVKFLDYEVNSSLPDGILHQLQP